MEVRQRDAAIRINIIDDPVPGVLDRVQGRFSRKIMQVPDGAAAHDETCAHNRGNMDI